MAEDVAAGAAARPAPERPASERAAPERPGPSRAERAHSSAYYTRFSFAFALLIALGVGAIGALVLVLVHPGAKHSPAWSTFKPHGSPIAMERQIATKVAAEYRASTATRLVTVFPGPLEASQFFQTDSGPKTIQVPISSIAVQPQLSTGQHEEGDFTFYSPDSTVAYNLCGFGASQQNCGLVVNTGRNPAGLLHREALELALYTLKYVPGTNAVIAYLPPTGSSTASKAVLIARKDVKEALHLPLARTLEPGQVILGAGMPNGAHVGELTATHVYTSDYQTLPGRGTAVLVLTPVAGGQ